MPRIRNFYMRKVKTCQQFFHDKLNTIVTEFPMVEVCLHNWLNVFGRTFIRFTLI